MTDDCIPEENLLDMISLHDYAVSKGFKALAQYVDKMKKYQVSH